MALTSIRQQRPCSSNDDAAATVVQPWWRCRSTAVLRRCVGARRWWRKKRRPRFGPALRFLAFPRSFCGKIDPIGAHFMSLTAPKDFPPIQTRNFSGSAHFNISPPHNLLLKQTDPLWLCMFLYLFKYLECTRRHCKQCCQLSSHKQVFVICLWLIRLIDIEMWLGHP